MTQEEKARRYDEAIERAKAFNNGEDVNIEAGTTLCEYIFPELKESESERIRKALIALLKFGLKDGSAIAPGFNETKEQAITWLEKQGKLALESINKEKQVGVADSEMIWQKKTLIKKACDWLDKNAEDYTIDGGLSVECLIYAFEKAMEE